MKKKEFFIPFHVSIFIIVVLLFFIFAGSFIAYQYQREKIYRIELFNAKLQGINNRMFILLPKIDEKEHIQYYIDKYLVDLPNIKLTIIKNGKEVVYDSFAPDSPMVQKDYWQNNEIKAALKDGSGYEIRKDHISSTYYYFSATVYPHYVIRSAVPYDSLLQSTLKSDNTYLTFSFIIAMLLIAFFYSYTTKLGYAISKLRKFAQKAEEDKFIQWENEAPTFKGELGEVTQQIIRVYRNLHDTKEALSIEKDKIFLHLQYSREGLGFFSANRTAILVNKLFIHYSSQISDFNIKNNEDILHYHEMKPIMAFIEEVQYTPSAYHNKRKSILINKNGKEFILECMIFEDMGFELSINDITYEEEKKQLKKQLTQNIAHELKTPVSSIQGYLETIVERPTLPDKTRINFLNKCYAQSNRLAKLLQDLSLLTRMEELDDLYEKQTIEIYSLVKTILDDIELDLKKKNIKVHNMLKHPLNIEGSQSLVYSIFRNLLDNSISYAGEDIEIFINCYKETEDELYFSYKDTGVGIPTEHLNRLFERFYRVDEGRTRKHGGTGLGLSIVKNAVHIHGGNIIVKSEVNKGVEFIFMLPRNYINPK